MIKHLFTLLLLCTVSTAWAQKQPLVEVPVNAEGKIYYEGVVKVDSTFSKNDLYMRGREWFVNTYVDAKEVLQLDDKADGKMMGKGVYKYTFMNGINVSEVTMTFTLNLEARDGRYRYRIYGFKGRNANTSALSAFSTTPSAPNIYVLDYDQINADLKAGKRPGYNGKTIAGLDVEVKKILDSLEKAMRDPKAAASKEW